MLVVLLTAALLALSSAQSANEEPQDQSLSPDAQQPQEVPAPPPADDAPQAPPQEEEELPPVPPPEDNPEMSPKEGQPQEHTQYLPGNEHAPPLVGGFLRIPHFWRGPAKRWHRWFQDQPWQPRALGLRLGNP
uniref:basic salivary proline-rich protein 4 n=1 Tax=Jaculus jaculus TaxID=51337 RepID=UPI001E1B09EA|nr:basic salivary proline-rich protein 4 [Jaculus jaculus]